VFLLSPQQDVGASRPYVTADVASPLYNSNFEIPMYVEREFTFLQFLCWFAESRLFVYVYTVDCKVRSAACRDNAHVLLKRKGFISKMYPALFLAVFCTNDKDGIVKYRCTSQCRVAFVGSVPY
jgi:hypothetical protein